MVTRKKETIANGFTKLSFKFRLKIILINFLSLKKHNLLSLDIWNRFIFIDTYFAHISTRSAMPGLRIRIKSKKTSPEVRFYGWIGRTIVGTRFFWQGRAREKGKKNIRKERKKNATSSVTIKTWNTLA